MQIKGVSREKKLNGRALGDGLEIWEKPRKNRSVSRSVLQMT